MRPAFGAFVVAAPTGEANPAIHGDPAQDLRRDEVLRLAAHLPDALVGRGCLLDGLIHEAGDDVPHGLGDGAATAGMGGERVEQHPPHVVLVLVERSVPDADRLRSEVAGQMIQRAFGEIGLAADAVHDLQLGRVPRRRWR